jgi:prevent-host-death family protein
VSVVKIERNEATASLADYVGQVGGSPIVITESGKPVAVLLSANAADLETLSLTSNAEFWKIIERSRTRDENEGTISLEDVRLMFAHDGATTRVADEDADYRVDNTPEPPDEAGSEE